LITLAKGGGVITQQNANVVLLYFLLCFSSERHDIV